MQKISALLSSFHFCKRKKQQTPLFFYFLIHTGFSFHPEQKIVFSWKFWQIICTKDDSREEFKKPIHQKGTVNILRNMIMVSKNKENKSIFSFNRRTLTKWWNYNLPNHVATLVSYFGFCYKGDSEIYNYAIIIRCIKPQIRFVTLLLILSEFIVILIFVYFIATFMTTQRNG